MGIVLWRGGIDVVELQSALKVMLDRILASPMRQVLINQNKEEIRLLEANIR